MHRTVRNVSSDHIALGQLFEEYSIDKGHQGKVKRVIFENFKNF